MTPFVEPAGVFVREAITNAYYDARDAFDAGDDDDPERPVRILGVVLAEIQRRNRANRDLDRRKSDEAVLAALGIPADATTDDIKAANLAGIAGRSPVDVRAGLILLDRLRNSSYRQDVDKATFAIQQAQRDYAAAVAEVEEAAR